MSHAFGSCGAYHVRSHEVTSTFISFHRDALLAEALCTSGMPVVPTSDLASETCIQLGLVCTLLITLDVVTVALCLLLFC